MVNISKVFPTCLSTLMKRVAGLLSDVLSENILVDSEFWRN